MNAVVAALLALHGIIHLLGFLKSWNLADVPQLSGRTSIPLSPASLRVLGAVWLCAAVLFVAAALLRLAGREAWWTVAAPALLLSQAAIVLQWQDAWAGTIANVILAAAVAVAAGTQSFAAGSRVEARELFRRVDAASAAILQADDVASLPPPVRRWLEASGAVGRPRARTVRLRQRGGLRTSPGQEYMPAEALQYFTVDDPAFLWMVDVTMVRAVPVVGRDTFVNGRGRMLIKAAGLVTVADGTGPKFDQGAALRFLGEIVWFPSAAAAPYINWSPLDDRRARATLSYAGVEVSAEFQFDASGRFVMMTAQRYLNGESLETWVIPATEWKVIRGIEMPVRGGAVWKLAAGDFDYYQWEILDVETNRTSLWDED